MNHVFKPKSTIWTYVPDSVMVTSEQGRYTTETGGLAQASDTLLPWFEFDVSYKDSLAWESNSDSMFYRIFETEDIVGQKPDSVAIQPIFQRFVTGINPSLSPENILLFPNPVKDRLFISTASPVKAPLYITVYASNGKLVLKERRMVVSSENEIHFSSYPAGLYFVKLQIGQETIFRKFIKQ